MNEYLIMSNQYADVLQVTRNFILRSAVFHLACVDGGKQEKKGELICTFLCEGLVFPVEFRWLFKSTMVDMRLPGLLRPWRQKHTDPITLDVVDAFIKAGF